MIRSLLKSCAAIFLLGLPALAKAQTPVPMASQSGGTYTENFADIANWTDNFAAGTGASRWKGVTTNSSGTVPDGITITAGTTAFVTSGSSGGVQRGSLSGNPAGTIVLLSTGATTTTTATAIDFFLDYTGVNAGTISFDWTRVNNSSGDRGGSLRVYTSTDGTNYTELTAAAVNNIINNGGTASGSITTVALPAGFNNSATARIRFYYFNGTTAGTSGSRPKISIDNLTVTAVAGCTTPSTQASALSAANITTGGADLSWTAGNGAGSMVVLRPTAQISTAPSSGTAYTANTAWASAGQIDASNRVVFRAAGNTVSGITGLTAGTQYTATTYEYSAANCYNTTSPATTSFYTYSTEPAAYNAAFTATASAYNQVDLSFSAPNTVSNAAGYLILQRTGAAPTSLPADGQAYTVGATIGDATVAAIVSSASATAQSITGLNSSTTYYYTLIPYNWNGTNAPTYNYNTSTPSGANATTPVGPSSSSDIISNAGGGFYTTNIDYTQWQSTTINSIGTGVNTGVAVHSLQIRDGGAAADADALPTTLTGLTVGYTGTAGTVRSAALFDGATKIATGTVTANSISFSGLNVSAADDATKTLTLAVTFNTTVTDNDKLVFTVSSATTAANTVSSQFAAANAGGAASDNNAGNDNNRIEVTATQLAFVQQPTTTSVNIAMAPAVTVAATDANNNRDLDYTAAVSLTSTGTLTGAPVSVAAASGLATFSSLTHTAAGSSLTLTATSGSFSSVTSNTFGIVNIVFVNGDYRTTGSGTWGNNTASPAIWERFNGTTWAASNSPAYNTSANVYIQHTITSGGAYASAVNIKVMNGGVFNSNHTATTASIYVYDGGTFNLNNVSLINNGNFDVEDNATVNIAYNPGSTATSFTSNLWAGTEAFRPKSKFVIKDLPNQSGFTIVSSNTEISTYTNPVTGTAAMFGNLVIDMSGSSNSQPYNLMSTGINGNLTHNDLDFKSSVSTITSVRICANGTNTATVGHDLIIESGFVSPINTTTSGNMTLNIKGNFRHQGPADFRTIAGSTNGSAGVINIDSNLVIQGGVVRFNSSSTANTALGTINLKGDLSIDATGLLTSSNSSGVTNHALNFTGTGDGLTPATTQTIDIASTDAVNENKYVPFFVKSGAYVQLANRNLELGTTGSVTVENGGVFDFGFNGATPLTVGISGSQTGSVFTTASGGTLKITSPDGITSSGALGNVVTATRSFNAGGIYQYTGSAAQAQGSGLPATVTGLVVNNALGVTLSQPVTVSGSFTLTSGKINTTSTNSLTINAGASINGGSSSSFVNGPLIVKTNSTATIPLPVGKGSAYGPAAVKPVGTTATTFTAEYFNAANTTPDYTNMGTSTMVKVDSFQYWDIARTAGTENASVTVSWGASSNVTFGGDLTVAHYNGTAWENAGRSGSTGTIAAGTITSQPVSNFSPFTLGFTSATPLTVKLASFSAAKRQSTVAVNWTTAEELTSDRFELERSENGKDFKVLTTVKATGRAAAYDYTDAAPAQGNNYYRLAMVAANGKKAYSDVRMVNMGSDKAFAVAAYPNPVTDKLTVMAANKTATATVQVTDLTGKVLQQVMMSGDVAEIDMTSFAAGVYLVRYADGTHTELLKVTK